ncbi:MAG: hypothetical protein KF850_15825 [Labilithrix sp.]|nr:hypothetical protein [Labilithrix sp.]
MRATGFASFLLPALAATAALFACGDDPATTDTPAAPDASDVDARSDAGDTPLDAGADDDGASDADTGPDADVPPKTCSDDGWCHTPVPPEQILRDVWSDGAGGSWAVSDQGAILRYDGTAWSVVHTYAATDPRLVSIWGSGPTDIWIGAYGAILHGTGATPANIAWTEIALDQLAPGAGAVSIYGTSKSDVFAAVRTAVLRLGEDEATWEVDPVTSEIAGTAVSVWGRSGASDVWITSQNATTRRSVLFHRSGGAESSFTPVTGVSEVPFTVSARPCATPGEPRRGWMVDDGTLWLVGTRINFTFTCHYAFRGVARADAGDTDAGAFAFDGRVFYDPYLGQNDIWGSAPNDVWLAGDYGTLHHWDGATWQLAGITVGAHPVKKNLNAIHGRGPGNIWVVGDGIALRKGTP